MTRSCRDRGRRGRNEAQERRRSSGLDRRRFRPQARRRHDGRGGGRRKGGRQARQDRSIRASTTCRWISRVRSTYQKIALGLDDAGKIVAIDHDLVSAWPTKRWGIPGLPDDRRTARRRRSTASPSTAPTSTIRCRTTRSAQSSTRWRRAPRRRASCGRWRPDGRSGRSKA